jgi:zinc protease
MKNWLCGTALAAILAPLIAFSARAEDVTTFTLKNGLDVVVLEDHRAPLVVQMVWYRAGSADEARGKSGVAHYLEHLMFKGTKTMAPGELSRVVEANGGSDNAFTSYDYTAYFQSIAADRLPLIMRMEADRMRNLSLTENDWKTERDVIIEERNLRTDSDPGAIFHEQLGAAQYLNHPYGTPIIGWRHEMESLTREDALDWYRLYYAPNDATLVIAGDVTPEQVKALAEEYYGPLEPSPAIKPRHRVTEPPQLAERTLVYQDPRVSQPMLSRSYLAPERNPGDQRTAAALTILAEALGGNGQTSVLGRAMQFGSKTAISTFASYDGTSLDKTTFNLGVVPAEGVTLEAAEAEVDSVLADFLKTGIDKDQLARIKTQIEAADVYSRDSVHGRAMKYGEGLTIGLTIRDIEDWPGILASITGDEVMAAAHLVLDRRASVTGLMERGEEAAQ